MKYEMIEEMFKGFNNIVLKEGTIVVDSKINMGKVILTLLVPKDYQDHGLCEHCEKEKAIISILRKGLKVCMTCAPKFV